MRGKHRTEYIGSDSASLSGYIFELSFNILYVVLVGEERRNIWLCDRVVRFIMEKTVEEKILTLQKKKEDLFERFLILNDTLLSTLLVSYCQLYEAYMKTYLLCYSTLGDSEEAVVQKLGEDDIKSLFA